MVDGIDSWSNAHEDGETTEEPSVLFDAMLTPHRSLAPRGFLLLMTAVCSVSFIAGLAFFLIGAWPVVGFVGLDVLLIYWAFRVNYARARMHETLRLTRNDLTVRRVTAKGEVSSWQFQPAWLQVVMDDPPRPDSQLTLRSHGNSLAIGGFLTPDERLDLAHTLQRKLMEARSAPGVI